MDHTYTIHEQIDRYLRNEMSKEELAEFNSKISIDEKLKKLVDTQRIVNQAVIDKEMINLKQRMIKILMRGKTPPLIGQK